MLIAWIAGRTGFLESHRPVTNVLAEVLALLLIVLAWRFHRGRLAVAWRWIGERSENAIVRECWNEAKMAVSMIIL